MDSPVEESECVRRHVPDVTYPAVERLQESDVYDRSGRLRVSVVREHMRREGRLTVDCMAAILRKSIVGLRALPNVLSIKAPINVCGDVHGQYYDLIHMLDIGGDVAAGQQYLFLGDYVDRGMFSCETLLLLLCLQQRYPGQVHLLRGNHECRLMAEHFTFLLECRKKYNDDIFGLFMDVCDSLPLAAVLETDAGDYVAMHGGIGPKIKTMEDIQDLHRFEEIGKKGSLCDILWSDPLHEPDPKFISKPEDLAEVLEIDFMPNPARGCACFYGHAGVMQFLERNSFLTIIRAHEVQEEGYKLHRNVDGTERPSVITMFSAPNYCNTYKNTAAMLLLEASGTYSFKQYQTSPAPYCLPKFHNVIDFSLPMIAEHTVRALVGLLKICTTLSEEEEASMRASQEALHRAQKSSILNKVRVAGKLLTMYEEIRQKQEIEQQLCGLVEVDELPEGLLQGGRVAVADAISSFDKAKRLDEANEMMPGTDTAV